MPSRLFKVFRKKDPEVNRPSNVDDITRTTGSKSLNHGLIELYAGGSDPILDIIFVHGLTGNAFKTWFDEKSDVHWPSDLLSKDFPDARIFTWGYDADVVGFLQQAGGSRISNHAETLVGDIVGERSSNNVKERPIIFVSHSLGGLVTEYALTVSRQSLEDRLRSVEQDCIGIVFLGTPHAGADLATIFRKVAHLTMGNVNRDIVAVLEPGSEMLRRVERDFGLLYQERLQGSRSLKIICCYEELEVRGLGYIVKQHQAELKPHPFIPIHANHMDMCKFSTRHDNGYLRIVREMKPWVQGLNSHDLIDKFPTNLSSQSTATKYTPREEKMVEARSFLKSRADERTRVLLLYGLSGSGKTQLAKALCRERIQDKSPAYIVNASSIITLHLSFSDFAVEAGLLRKGQNVNQEFLRSIVSSYLSKLKHEWVLLFDDCFDGKLARSWIPEKSSGSIIVTSQEKIAVDPIPCLSICVQQMTESEARCLFCDSANLSMNELKDDEKRMIDYLAQDQMGGLPIVIAQAGVYFAQTSPSDANLQASLETYIQDFHDYTNASIRDVGAATIDEYGKSLLTIFDMALKGISGKSETATHLLLLLCCLHHRDIYMAWFATVAKQFDRYKISGLDIEDEKYALFRRLFKPDASGNWSGHIFTKALHTLEAYGLLLVQSETIQLHPLINSLGTAHLNTLNTEVVQHYFRLAAVVLCESFVIDEIHGNEIDADEQSKLKLFTHAAALIGKSFTLLDAAETSCFNSYALNRLSDYLGCSSFPSVTGEMKLSLFQLNILAFADGVSNEGLSCRQTLYALRKMLIRTAEERHLSYESACKLYAWMDEMIDSSEFFNSRGINKFEEHALLLLEQAYITGLSMKRDCFYKVAKKGLDYLDANKDSLTVHLLLKLQIQFHCFTSSSESSEEERSKSICALEQCFEAAVALCGYSSYLAINAYSAIRMIRNNEGSKVESNQDMDVLMDKNDTRLRFWSRGIVLRATILSNLRKG